jgi:release factor glutamine methyltransferase
VSAGSSLALVDVLTRTEGFLRTKGILSPRLEAELLLSHVLGLERLQLYLAHDRPLTPAELDRLRPLVRRRGAREPLSWVVGERGFHRIDLFVEPGVLDPRPDTETIVDAFLSLVPETEAGPVYVADIGTGTGAIGLAIAHARPAARVYATDVSPDALRVARRNVERLGLGDRVAVLEGDLLSAIPARRPIHWIVSNLPYIPREDLAGLQPEVSQHEPRLALDGGADGLTVIRRLVDGAARATRGILLEVGAGQAPRVSELVRRAGFAQVSSVPDAGGIQRVVIGVRAP